MLLALSSLAFQTESTRSLIADYQPSFLPHLLKALSHPSYGVRAAACQLTRALSRNIAVLRTSLTDTGVADGVVDLLQRECAGRLKGSDVPDHKTTSDDLEESASSEERGWTVEVAATGTICNLVADFSPLRSVSLLLPVSYLCYMADDPSEAFGKWVSTPFDFPDHVAT